MTYRFHGIFVAIALALSAGIAHAQDATGDLVPYVDTQLVGFTSTTVTGDAGVLGMTNACHLEFSATRMCTSEEVMNTVAMPVLPADTWAWVRPVIDYDTDGTWGKVHQGDVSGAHAWMDYAHKVNGHPTRAGGMSCEGWSDATTTYGEPNPAGLSVNSTGRFEKKPCSTSQPVACCARIIVVPEPSASLQLGTGILGLAALSGRAVCGS